MWELLCEVGINRSEKEKKKRWGNPQGKHYSLACVISLGASGFWVIRQHLCYHQDGLFPQSTVELITHVFKENWKKSAVKFTVRHDAMEFKGPFQPKPPYNSMIQEYHFPYCPVFWLPCKLLPLITDWTDCWSWWSLTHTQYGCLKASNVERRGFVLSSFVSQGAGDVALSTGLAHWTAGHSLQQGLVFPCA